MTTMTANDALALLRPHPTSNAPVLHEAHTLRAAVTAIAEVVKERSIPFLVDGVRGALSYFSPYPCTEGIVALTPAKMRAAMTVIDTAFGIVRKTPAIGNSAIALCVHDRRVCLGLRAKDPNRGLYVLPGGKIQIGEEARKAARRELREETGLDAAIGELLDVCEIIEGDEHRLISVFAATVEDPKITCGGDLTEARWFTYAEIRKLYVDRKLSKPTVGILRRTGWLPDETSFHHGGAFRSLPVERTAGKRVAVKDPNTFHFVHEDVSEEDAQALLNGFPPGHPHHVPELWDEALTYERFDNGALLAHLMARAGCFPSVKQARGAGWDKPVPTGYNHYVVGKRKISVVVVNRIPPD
jgi:ADP-ribose pyrophosphatase YjhB (NUDIX family)